MAGKFWVFELHEHSLEELDAKARAEVAKLGGNPLLEDFLDELLARNRVTGDKNEEQ